MTDDETRYGDPDYDGLYQSLIDAPYPFKAVSGGAEVYVDYRQQDSIGTIAHRHGFDIRDVYPVDGGEFGARVKIEHKELARGMSDGTEEAYNKEESNLSWWHCVDDMGGENND